MMEFNKFESTLHGNWIQGGFVIGIFEQCKRCCNAGNIVGY